jgi:D-sedoheptulose 7-phosphate isomerase
MNIIDYISASIETKQKILNDKKIVNSIEEISEIIVKAYRKEKKVLIAGNGGSSCDAQHIAGELVAKFYFDRPALSAIALTTDIAVITAVGNDFSADDIYYRQIQANANRGDVFIAISTSGNSKNIIKAAKLAKTKDVTVVALTGENSCILDTIADFIIKVPSHNTPIIQESHIMLGHLICGIVEEKMFKEGIK